LRPGVEYGELRDAKEHIVSYWIEYTKKIGSPADRETILEWLFLKCLDAIDDFIELAQTADDEITNFAIVFKKARDAYKDRERGPREAGRILGLTSGKREPEINKELLFWHYEDLVSGIYQWDHSIRNLPKNRREYWQDRITKIESEAKSHEDLQKRLRWPAIELLAELEGSPGSAQSFLTKHLRPVLAEKRKAGRKYPRGFLPQNPDQKK